MNFPEKIQTRPSFLKKNPVPCLSLYFFAWKFHPEKIHKTMMLAYTPVLAVHPLEIPSKVKNQDLFIMENPHDFFLDRLWNIHFFFISSLLDTWPGKSTWCSFSPLPPLPHVFRFFQGNSPIAIAYSEAYMSPNTDTYIATEWLTKLCLRIFTFPFKYLAG